MELSYIFPIKKQYLIKKNTIGNIVYGYKYLSLKFYFWYKI